MAVPRNVEDYRRRAAQRLPRLVFDYLEGGAEDERGLARNRTAIENFRFEPQRLVDVSARDLSTELFGRKLPLPLLIAPTGLNGVFWPDGDVELARAAAKAGIPFILSTASTTRIEEVAERAGGELWFQLYVVQRDLAAALTRRALDAGYTTLVLTVDVAVNGKRERDTRNGFGIPFRYTPRVLLDGALRPAWTLAQLRHGLPQLANFASAAGPGNDVTAQAALMRRQMDASFSWTDLKALRDAWPHRLIVKGLLRAEDAARCEECGVDAVVISNHGGRQLEDVAAPIDRVEEFASRVDCPVLVDSGFRRGADIVKAVALGARAVLLGRATLYGLAAAGEAGASDVIEILRREIDTTLALIGAARLADVGHDRLAASD
jgi:(S)-mandelate dehydrogenase